MKRTAQVLWFLLVGGLPLAAGDEVVFRSDVSLVRVDAQVLDRDNRAITGLRAEDFVLLEEGRAQQIRNFARENMPVDVLLLLDVSSSMKPHIQRIANASHQAFGALGNDDRVAIMVFDRATRLRLPFRGSREDVTREFDRLLRQETFNGGTDITGALLDAARYVGRSGRRDARRAIVIVTDDQTERDRNEAAVSHALVEADAVLSAIIAPDAMGNRGYSPGRGGGGSYPGGGWPGGSGRRGGPLGGIILGPGGGGYPGGGPYPGGGRTPGPTTTGPRTKSAGIEEIARESGGDSMPVEDASALETTLSRIRQRYALHFRVPDGVRAGQARHIDVELADAARRRYPDAELRFRRLYVTPAGSPDAAVANAGSNVAESADPVVVSASPAPRRKVAVSEPDGPRGANPSAGAGKPSAAPSKTEAAPANPDATSQPQPSGGWRRLKPGEQP